MKTTVRNHVTAIRRALIKKTRTSVGEAMEKLEPQCTVGRNEEWSIWKSSLVISKMVKHRATTPTAALLGIWRSESL